ncbi:hypothetical protein JCM8547_004806 [Rhodosporidiobolus lusitaniae]
MSRRAAGYSSLQRHLDTSSSYSSLSSSLAAQQSSTLASQLSTFQSALQTFSSTHRQKILSSPSFRTHFSQLCAELGVDPLGGGGKGLWDKVGLGDWYHALGVQVVDVCLRARERGGGFVPLEEVLREVKKLRGGGGGQGGKVAGQGEVSEADVQRAVEALEPLGSGYAILVLPSSGKKVVRCSPGSLDRDSLVVVEAAQSTGRGAVTLEELRAFAGGWEGERAERALEKAVMEDGMVWVDEQAGDGDGGLGGREWWAPGLFVME